VLPLEFFRLAEVLRADVAGSPGGLVPDLLAPPVIACWLIGWRFWSGGTWAWASSTRTSTASGAAVVEAAASGALMMSERIPIAFGTKSVPAASVAAAGHCRDRGCWRVVHDVREHDRWLG
jgi:hypothetical protein